MNMKNVRIAILDDEIHRVPRGFLSWTRWGLRNGIWEDTIDTQKQERHWNGHGETCLQIMAKYLQKASVELHCLTCFGPNKSTGDVDVLLSALDHCLSLDVDLIHLSIGSSEYEDFPRIEEHIRPLLDRNVMIVAAQNNRNTITFPAWLDGVLAVRADPALIDGRFYAYLPGYERIDFCASSRHLLRAENSMQVTPVANSFAAPVITAAAADYCCMEKDPSAERFRSAANRQYRRPAAAHQLRNQQSEETFPIPAIWLHGFTTEAAQEISNGILRHLQKTYCCIVVMRDRFFASVDVSAQFEVPSCKTYRASLIKLVQYFNADLMICCCDEIRQSLFDGLHVWRNDIVPDIGEENVSVSGMKPDECVASVLGEIIAEQSDV